MKVSRCLPTLSSVDTNRSCSQIIMFISKNETMCKVQKPGNSKHIIHVSNIHVQCQLHKIRHKSILLGAVGTKKAKHTHHCVQWHIQTSITRDIKYLIQKQKLMNHFCVCMHISKTRVNGKLPMFTHISMKFPAFTQLQNNCLPYLKILGYKSEAVSTYLQLFLLQMLNFNPCFDL
jgi:hypothetical protein